MEYGVVGRAQCTLHDAHGHVCHIERGRLATGATLRSFCLFGDCHRLAVISLLPTSATTLIPKDALVNMLEHVASQCVWPRVEPTTTPRQGFPGCEQKSLFRVCGCHPSPPLRTVDRLAWLCARFPTR